jgi:hypothetical protein
MTSLGIEPVTFRLVAQWLDQLRYSVSLIFLSISGNYKTSIAPKISNFILNSFIWEMTLERTGMGVPEVCTGISSCPLVPESVSLLDRALRYEGNAV